MLQPESPDAELLIPPPELRGYVGVGDFLEIGREFFRYFVALGDLQPHHRVLDVGCGIGRMAMPLIQYLNQSGSYRGFDIVEEGIAWCQGHITTRYPNFVFEAADIYNKYYNPSGRQLPEAFRFPFLGRSFDFVFATSVFTHMLPAGVEHYLREIARVMKPGATSLITFFLLNEESLGLVNGGKSSQGFVFPVEGCLTTEADVPEASIAYPEDWVRALYTSCGLTIRVCHYGSWCERPRPLSYQDIVIATA